jgi:SsrA-binding protein
MYVEQGHHLLVSPVGQILLLGAELVSPVRCADPWSCVVLYLWFRAYDWHYTEIRLKCEEFAIVEYLNDMSTFITNRRARFDFEIIDTLEAGIALLGNEAKSIRNGRAKLDGSYVLVRGGEAFWVGGSIAPYQMANTPKSYDPERPRKLLLSKKELVRLSRATEQERLTAVGISLYSKGRKIKLQIGIARGKKKADKREAIKARDVKRDINRTLKSQ